MGGFSFTGARNSFFPLPQPWRFIYLRSHLLWVLTFFLETFSVPWTCPFQPPSFSFVPNVTDLGAVLSSLKDAFDLGTPPSCFPHYCSIFAPALRSGGSRHGDLAEARDLGCSLDLWRLPGRGWITKGVWRERAPSNLWLQQPDDLMRRTCRSWASQVAEGPHLLQSSTSLALFTWQTLHPPTVSILSRNSLA